MPKQALKLDAPAMSFVVQGPDDFERVHELPDRKPFQIDVVALTLRAKNREVELNTWGGSNGVVNMDSQGNSCL